KSKNSGWFKGKFKEIRDKAAKNETFWSQMVLICQGGKYAMFDKPDTTHTEPHIDRNKETADKPPPYAPPTASAQSPPPPTSPPTGLYPVLEVKEGHVTVRGLSSPPAALTYCPAPTAPQEKQKDFLSFLSESQDSLSVIDPACSEALSVGSYTPVSPDEFKLRRLREILDGVTIPIPTLTPSQHHPSPRSPCTDYSPQSMTMATPAPSKQVGSVTVAVCGDWRPDATLPPQTSTPWASPTPSLVCEAQENDEAVSHLHEPPEDTPERSAPQPETQTMQPRLLRKVASRGEPGFYKN
ncbi:hypothetical protein XENOCAPTIV_028524, partial [Xenoophorus captivus]